MYLEKLLEIEAQQGFDDINAIRTSGINSFMDEWIVTGVLGRGSFGNVYRIIKPIDGLTPQECALKVCQINNAEETELKLQEIESQKLLSGHPNVVQIEDYAVIYRAPPRTSYILIRLELLIPLPSEGLNESQTIHLGIDLCNALEKCISMQPKLIHCDIKPANILVDESGRYKLGDFGTAKTLQSTMTYAGNRGTPLYMAPEVARFSGYDSRCDIFSLGYTMLTMLNGGQHPFKGSADRPDVVLSMYESRMLPHISGVSTRLMKIIGKMCEPNVRFRYSTPSEVKHDLEKLIRLKESTATSFHLKSPKNEANKKVRLDRSIKAADIATRKNMRSMQKAQDSLERKSGTSLKKTEETIKRFKKDAECINLLRQSLSDGNDFKSALINAIENGLSGDGVRLVNSARRIGTGWICLIALIAMLTVIGGAVIWQSSYNPELIADGKTVVTSEGLILAASDDREGYKVIGYNASGDTDVTVPSKFKGFRILGIDDNAFANEEITSITIEKGITEIGDYAFSGCNKMTSIKIPDSVLSVGEGTFKDCSMLVDITLPGGTSYIGDSAFMGCSSLKAFVVPEDVERIHKSTFENCTSFVKVIFYEGIVSIDERAFFGCNNLKYVTIPRSVVSIEANAFTGCTSLKITSQYPSDHYGYKTENYISWYSMVEESETSEE